MLGQFWFLPSLQVSLSLSLLTPDADEREHADAAVLDLRLLEPLETNTIGRGGGQEEGLGLTATREAGHGIESAVVNYFLRGVETHFRHATDTRESEAKHRHLTR